VLPIWERHQDVLWREPAAQPLLRTLEQLDLIAPDERREALSRLEGAIAADDEQGIVAAWVDGNLESYPLAQHYRGQYEAARDRAAFLERFQEAVATDDDEKIVAAAHRSILTHPRVTREERKRLADANRRETVLEELRRTVRAGDDVAILAKWSEAVQAGCHVPERLTERERRAVELAWERVAALRRFRQAIETGDEEQIVGAYDAHLLQGYSGMTVEDNASLYRATKCYEMKRAVREALARGDPREIGRVYAPERMRSFTPFTLDEEKLIQEALVQVRKDHEEPRAEALVVPRPEGWLSHLRQRLHLSRAGSVRSRVSTLHIHRARQRPAKARETDPQVEQAEAEESGPLQPAVSRQSLAREVGE
jgi:hypothetical protein